MTQHFERGGIVVELLHSGDLFKHYKGGLYQIVTRAIHTETEEYMVVYQALYGEFKVFVRPENMFFESVTDEDGKKVPRFERVTGKVTDDAWITHEDEGKILMGETKEPDMEEEIIEGVNPVLIKFLDSENIEEKLEILRTMRKKLDDKTITDIAVTMDLVIEDGELEDRIKSLENCLKTRAKYETTRLR